MYWHPFFLSFLLPSSLLLISFIPFIQSFIHPFLLPWNLHVSSFCFPPDLIPAPVCSDKDLLSQTRTLAMSFVKCASTDTEHQYKLVKDISFWGQTRTYARTCRHTAAYDRVNKWTQRNGTFLFYLHTIFRWFYSLRAARESGETFPQ